jgi:PII-like signaling protein
MASWKKLKIYLAETDQWQHQALYQVIVEKARHYPLAGATVTRAIEGFGADLKLRSSNILALSDDLPITISIVDDEQKVRDFYQKIKEMIPGKLVILEAVEVLQYDP